MFLASLNRRDRRAEVMDDPALDVQKHRAALQGLSRINFFSRSAGILWPELRRLAQSDPKQALSVLDVATGGGDVPIGLQKRARRAGLPIRFAGCDISPTALTHAREAAERAASSVEFFRRDVLHDGIADEYDVITCSLFLHHLDEPDATELFRQMARSARRLVLINDLTRSKMGLILAAIGSRLLTRSKVVHVDGPRSVRAAFTRDEALALASQSGLTGATAVGRWPCRYLLKWERGK